MTNTNEATIPVYVLHKMNGFFQKPFTITIPPVCTPQEIKERIKQQAPIDKQPFYAVEFDLVHKNGVRDTGEPLIFSPVANPCLGTDDCNVIVYYTQTATP